MPQLRNNFIFLFVVLIASTILALPSPIHAYRKHKDDFSLSPEPQQYPLLDQEQNMEAPYSSQDSNNNNSETQDDDIALYYNSPPSEAPSPSPIFSDESDNGEDGDDDAVTPEANSNVLPFNYSAEDDAGEFTNEYYSNEFGGYHVEKKHVIVFGIVVGAVCLVGLGGFVLKRKNQKKKLQYQNLYSKRDDEV